MAFMKEFFLMDKSVRLPLKITTTNRVENLNFRRVLTRCSKDLISYYLKISMI